MGHGVTPLPQKVARPPATPPLIFAGSAVVIVLFTTAGYAGLGVGKVFWGWGGHMGRAVRGGGPPQRVQSVVRVCPFREGNLLLHQR